MVAGGRRGSGARRGRRRWRIRILLDECRDTAGIETWRSRATGRWRWLRQARRGSIPTTISRNAWVATVATGSTWGSGSGGLMPWRGARGGCAATVVVLSASVIAVSPLTVILSAATTVTTVSGPRRRATSWAVLLVTVTTTAPWSRATRGPTLPGLDVTVIGANGSWPGLDTRRGFPGAAEFLHKLLRHC